jgi:hypothetical protein
MTLAKLSKAGTATYCYKFVVEVKSHCNFEGVSVDKLLYFDTEKEARTYVIMYNAFNVEEQAPDWYMQAEFTGKQLFPVFK